MFWMRSAEDTRERCNQKTTYIMPCDWEHAHDVMRWEPEQCFTVNILLHDSIWLQTMVSNRSRSCRAERRTVQRVNKPFYIIHCSFVCSIILCVVLKLWSGFFKQWMDMRPSSSCFAHAIYSWRGVIIMCPGTYKMYAYSVVRMN